MRPADNHRLSLALSAFFGAVIAVGNKTIWQDPIECAQVLAGIVTYPAENPFYTYHVKLWTLLNQLSAIVLSAGVSEITASLMLEGLAGAVAFASIFLVTVSISRKPLFALFLPMMMYSLSLVGASSAYPLALIGVSATYGVFGQAYMLLVIGLLGNRYYRAGAFLAGLAPAVHPSLGAFTFIITSISLLAAHKEIKPHLPRLIGFSTLGIIIMFISLGWQLKFSAHVPGLDFVQKKLYLDAFIRNLDFHRTAGRWSDLNVLYGILMAILSALALRQTDVPTGSRIVFYSIISSVAVTFMIVLAADTVPALLFLKILIPWRYINYANLCLLPVCLGLCDAESFRLPRLRAVLLIVVICGCFGWRLLQFHHVNALYGAILFSLLAVLAIRVPDLPDKLFAVPAGYRWLFVSALLALLLYRQVIPGLIALPAAKNVLLNWKNPDIYRTASSRTGIMATAGDMHMIQLVTRRPVLIDSGSIDFFAYVPETGPRFNNILRKVYGLDLFVKPSNKEYSKGLSYTHKQLWERRTAEEWRSIRKEFGVTDVLTPEGWELQLPKVATGEKMILYAVD